MKSLDRNDIEALDMYIRTSDRITVAVHIHPDGDAIGSAVAMLGYLSGLGRDAAVVLPDPHPSALGFLIEQAGKKVYTYSEAKEETEDRLLSSDLVICQDFNSFSRTGDLENVLRSAAGKALTPRTPTPSGKVAATKAAASSVEIRVPDGSDTR